MSKARPGSTVTISYIGTLDNGRIFYSTDEHGSLTVKLGEDQLFLALEQALIGMRAGEVKSVVLTAAEAYGPHLPENMIKVARHAFPAGKEITPGQKLSIEFSGDRSRVMVVSSVNEAEVTLDGNHPLAGQDLTFAIRVDKVE